MSVMTSQINENLTVQMFVLGIHQRKYQSQHYWPFVRGIHQWLVDSPHKGPVNQKAFPLHDVIMCKLSNSDRMYVHACLHMHDHNSWIFVTLLKETFKDLSMMYHALWDPRHEGAMRISQCTRRVAPSALTYPSGPWVPPISQCTIHHA